MRHSRMERFFFAETFYDQPAVAGVLFTLVVDRVIATSGGCSNDDREFRRRRTRCVAPNFPRLLEDDVGSAQTPNSCDGAAALHIAARSILGRTRRGCRAEKYQTYDRF